MFTAALGALIAFQVGLRGVVIDHEASGCPEIWMHLKPSHTVSSFVEAPQKVLVSQISVCPQSTRSRSERVKFLYCEAKIDALRGACLFPRYEYCSGRPWYNDVVLWKLWQRHANLKSHAVFNYGRVRSPRISENCIKATPFACGPLSRINDRTSNCFWPARCQQTSVRYFERGEFNSDSCLSLRKGCIRRNHGQCAEHVLCPQLVFEN